MKILFIGTVKSSKILLKKLISMNENIAGVLTKKESKFNSDFCDLTELCKLNDIDYRYVNNINDKENIDYIKEKKPDIIYCFGFSQILKEEIISSTKIGVIGFHSTNLPKNRGRHPIIWSLALGLRQTASTFFFIDQGADSGDILSQELIKIDYEDDAGSLYDKIMSVAENQVEKFTKQLKENNYIRIKQDDTKSNYWRKRGRLDGKIDWRMSSRSIYNLVRALYKPYIGSHFEYENDEYKVWKVEEVKKDGYENIEPGKIIEIYSEKSFLIKVGDNLLKVLDCEEINLKVGDYL